MPSENYRYYRLDGVGHLEGAEWFEAENDEDAICTLVQGILTTNARSGRASA